jgi:hypothetical protein
MKQVVFAIALLAMASLTGCLNTDDTSVDENTDTTSDNTGNTNDDGTIEPVGQSGGYTPPDKANITVSRYYEDDLDWVAKDGNQITTSCLPVSSGSAHNLVIYDSHDRIIYLGNDRHDYGANFCDNGDVAFDITLGPEPVKVGLQDGFIDSKVLSNHFYWVVTF